MLEHIACRKASPAVRLWEFLRSYSSTGGPKTLVSGGAVAQHVRLCSQGVNQVKTAILAVFGTLKREAFKFETAVRAG